MTDLKVVTHTTYTYETTDGREFDDKQEALDWEQAIETFRGIVMLNSKLMPTDEVDSAYYVHIKNWQEQEAFAMIQNYYGLCAQITEPGYWAYDECADQFIDISKEITRLMDIVKKLAAA